MESALATATCAPPSAAKFALRQIVDSRVEARMRTVFGRSPRSTPEIARVTAIQVMVVAYSLKRLEQLGRVVRSTREDPARPGSGGRATDTVVVWQHVERLVRQPSVFPDWLRPPLPDIPYSRQLVSGVAGLMAADDDNEPQENVA